MVSFCGGEPLVHTEADKIVQGIMDMGKYVIICTNALLLPKFLDKVKPSPYLSFAIHLDGLEKTHDYVTQRPGCFKKAIEASKMALDRGYRVNCNTTVFAESNIEEIAELFRHIKEDLGFHGIITSPGYDFDQTGTDFFLKRQQVIERFKKLLSLVKEEWFGNSQLYLDFLKGEMELTCTAWGNPTRTPKGWQGPCYMLRDAYYPDLPRPRRQDAVAQVRPRVRGAALQDLHGPRRLRADGGERPRHQARQAAVQRRQDDVVVPRMKLGVVAALEDRARSTLAALPTRRAHRAPPFPRKPSLVFVAGGDRRESGGGRFPADGATTSSPTRSVRRLLRRAHRRPRTGDLIRGPDDEEPGRRHPPRPGSSRGARKPARGPSGRWRKSSSRPRTRRS
jgi:hypothetical protein